MPFCPDKKIVRTKKLSGQICFCRRCQCPWFVCPYCPDKKIVRGNYFSGQFFCLDNFFVWTIFLSGLKGIYHQVEFRRTSPLCLFLLFSTPLQKNLFESLQYHQKHGFVLYFHRLHIKQLTKCNIVLKIPSTNLHSQTVRARKLKFWKKVHLPPPVTCHISCIKWFF